MSLHKVPWLVLIMNQQKFLGVDSPPTNKSFHLVWLLPGLKLLALALMWNSCPWATYLNPIIHSFNSGAGSPTPPPKDDLLHFASHISACLHRRPGFCPLTIFVLLRSAVQKAASGSETCPGWTCTVLRGGSHPWESYVPQHISLLLLFLCDLAAAHSWAPWSWT